MLAAKISPKAKKVMQVSPLETKEFTADYMSAKCTKLIIGGGSSHNDNTEFSLRFFNVKYDTNPDGSQGRAIMDIIMVHNVTFSQTELANWGTDDSIVLDLVAQKLGFTILSKDTLDIEFAA